MLRHFYVAMLAGLLIGTYSSVFNASQLVVVGDSIASRGKEPKKKAFEDKAMTSTPMVSSSTPAPSDDESVDESGSDKTAVKTARIQKKKKKRF